MALEIERKYLDADFDALRKKLLSMSAVNVGIHFEKNLIFDRGDLGLFKSGRLLRLRAQYWRDGEKYLLTFKLPASEPEGCLCKIREELELEIGDFERMALVLANLGYGEQACYEKFRECWLLPPREGGGRRTPVKIFLDLLPFGQIVEKESEIGRMDSFDRELGLDKLKISAKSYYELNREWRLSKGLKPSPGFVFGRTEKERIARELRIPLPKI